ncbi:hypothetical protein FPSE_09357 [Fusarium pseudograminearum CS3096]|uniref:Reverse transcriptase domain-containing protein n=1 Tax=Fusarium pseudograminearum (strain CS3096) TaxID=1028729 RepID=K3UFK8_FUSPC|nr:hypothetical protein FPSE_09357 [Fusarium pseudograminearum CS3096]EKJ70496.1 hypothetical protein FPSE_09357 [Fusarium pseudograminearum CS3096]
MEMTVSTKRSSIKDDKDGNETLSFHAVRDRRPETLHLSHDAIFKTAQLELKNSNELRKCHISLEEVRDYVNLTEDLISSAIPDIHPDHHAQAIKAARSRLSKLKDGLTALYDKLTPESVPCLHKVAFYVHNSIPTTSWRIDTPDDRNKGLVATLTLITPTGTLSIHNVYNRNLTIDVDLLVDYIKNFKGDAILLGDFNLHHPLWSGEGRGNVTSQSNLFASRIVEMGLELQTKRGKPPEPKSPVNISKDLTEDELLAILKDIKTGKSTGEDEIPNEAIRLGQEALFPYLLDGFRACIRLRTHPECFKKAIIVMIAKPGKDPNHPNSYRPITLLSHIGKLYEKIIANKITRAIRENPDMLPPTQFGGKSTTEALLYMINVIHDAWYSPHDKVVTILSLDMSGAFDNVLRDKVLEEMARVGLPAWIIETVASFLSDRDAKMRMPGIVSDEFELNTGIPQGSPLSPILFLIFAAPLLNDLGSHLGMQKIFTNEGRECWVDLYAFAFVDDIYFIAVSNSYQLNCEGITRLHTELIDIAQRLRATFGAPKYHTMHMHSPFGKKRHNNEIPEIPGVTELPQPVLTILGVEVDCQLTWKAHIDKIIEKCKYRKQQMMRISGATWGPKLHSMRLYYLTVIRPVITYGCGAWLVKPLQSEDLPKGVLTAKQLESLQSLQGDILRHVSGCHGKTARIFIEKDLFIQDILVVLYTQACLQRVKSMSGTDLRWRLALNSKYNPTKHTSPTHILNLECNDLILEACKSYAKDAALRCKVGNSGPYDQAVERITNRATRVDIVSNYLKRQATKECEELWNAYVDDRIQSLEARGGNRKTLPPAIIDEPWSKRSLGYYDGLTRAQSSMLLQCRSEFIGLISHLYTIKLSESPACPCGGGRQTPFHCFIQCRNLDNARELLQEKLGYTNYKDLLTVDGKIAAQWAIAYFDIEQYDPVRAKSTCFPVDPNFFSERANSNNLLQVSTLAQQRAYLDSSTSDPTEKFY